MIGSERPVCEIHGCHKFAIGIEQDGDWPVRKCMDHASDALRGMRLGEEFETRKQYRYRYQVR